MTLIAIDENYLYVDCQTSSGSAESGEIIELAWRIDDKNFHPIVERSMLAKTQKDLSKRTTQLTGIRSEDLLNALPINEVFQLFVADLRLYNIQYIIAHFASFERRFLEILQCEDELVSLQWLCTHRLSKFLFPDMPSHTLRALAGYFSYNVDELKRAKPHVEATRLVWQQLLAEFRTQEIESMAKICALQTQKLRQRKAIKHREIIAKEMRLRLPKGPGVYFFCGANARILYIGKATNLKDRVNSYFRGYTGKRQKQQEMLSQIKDIKVVECVTTVEAALVENDMIKKYSPAYNKALRQRNDPPVWIDYNLEIVPLQLAWRGPFFNGRVINEFQVVCQLLSGDLSARFAELVDVEAELYRSAIEILRNELLNRGVRAFAPRCYLALGLRAWRQQQKDREKALESDHEEELQIEDEDELHEFVWTAETLASRCLSIFTALAGQLRRASQIATLTNSDVYFRLASKQWRLLCLRNAEIAEAKTLQRKPTRITSRVAVVDHSTEIDVTRFDRLRVLHSELKRLKVDRIIAEPRCDS